MSCLVFAISPSPICHRITDSLSFSNNRVYAGRTFYRKITYVLRTRFNDRISPLSSVRLFYIFKKLSSLLIFNYFQEMIACQFEIGNLSETLRRKLCNGSRFEARKIDLKVVFGHLWERFLTSWFFLYQERFELKSNHSFIAYFVWNLKFVAKWITPQCCVVSVR